MWAAAALLCTTLASSYMALNYNAQKARLQEDYDELLQDVEDLTITINLKIDYGGGNVTWHNATRVPLDANLLTATQLLVDVDYTTSEFAPSSTRSTASEATSTPTGSGTSSTRTPETGSMAHPVPTSGSSTTATPSPGSTPCSDRIV